jgi:hypothetical protein
MKSQSYRGPSRDLHCPELLSPAVALRSQRRRRHGNRQGAQHRPGERLPGHVTAIPEINSIANVRFLEETEANGACDAKGSSASRPGLRDTARYCRTRATASELLSFTFKGWGACSEQWNEHHDRQNDSRIGRGSDCHRRNNDECIRSTKKGHSINTKAVVRNVDRGHSELGAANRASVRTFWWTSWPSHHQTAPDDSREVANGRSTTRPLVACCPSE